MHLLCSGFRLFPLAAALAIGNATATETGTPAIVHRGFDAFRRATLGDGGANTYVSAKGRFQTIERRDLNADGKIDFLFTQDHNHDYAPDALVYWGGPQGPKSLGVDLAAYHSPYTRVRHLAEALKQVTWLPSMGGGRCEIADINVDGYPDILFANTMHNFRQDLPAYVYWGGPQGFRAENRTVLPAYTVTGVAVADLNKDGLPDVVLANQGFEAAFEARFGKMTNNLASYIYWGSPLGLDAARRSSIPTVSARDVAVGDFNGDAHLDLAFANGSPEHSIFVYWGAGSGFREEQRQIVSFVRTALAGNVNALHAADVNGDGIDDLIVGGLTECIVLPGSKNGLADRNATLPADKAMEFASGDFNGDSFVDFVVANAGVKENEPPASVVYWGSQSGFEPSKRSLLPTQSAKAVHAADVNGDGRTDLVFGNSNDNRETPVQIFYGGADGYATHRQGELQGFGSVGVAVGDLNRDGKADVVLSNHLSGTEDLPTMIFWGNKEHRYSSASATVLEPGGTMMPKSADLDDDSFPDLVMVNDGVPTVWWGGESGYDSQRRTPLPTSHLPAGRRVLGMAVADFDRDGYLDVAAVGNEAREPNGNGPRLLLVFGNAQRFSRAKVIDYPLSGHGKTAGAIALTTADLNRDGHLDLIIPLLDIGVAEIWWGSADGFGSHRVTKYDTNGASAAVTADLDRDGWLEVIFTSGLRGKLRDGQTVVGGTGIAGTTRNSESIIHWGGPKGFEADTRVETYNALDATVADLNRDGHLDVAFSSYLSDTTRELPAIIYWGDGTRRGISNERRTFIDAASSAAIDAVDLDADGWRELVVTNHQKDFSHTSGTNIYWGGKDGFSIERRSSIPSIGAHLDTMVDVGNVYSREYQWELVSPPIKAPDDSKFSGIDWKADTASPSAIKMHVRTAATERELPDSPWKEVGGSNASNAGTSAFPRVRQEDRWLQYRAALVSKDGVTVPQLSEVSIQLARE